VNKGGRVIFEIKLESPLTKGETSRFTMLSSLSEQRSGRIYTLINNKMLLLSDISSLSKWENKRVVTQLCLWIIY